MNADKHGYKTCYLSAKDAKDAKTLNLLVLVIFYLIRVFCVFRGPFVFDLYTKALISCLRRTDMKIICVYLRLFADHKTSAFICVHP